ncbi:GT2 family glycosyltransferase [Halopolyspora algeriensis]|uniref:GT2 family glycosyltransferase n=1 Tax=Halopolyspora algeriensis TaxID=1500506 RepID=A0A368W0S1_9ACTN|nr:glycosyltransferase [Halopolyspora algeriensis]RCW47279.1 GT2 family glycosyltransferase [Halopolyspora algeriensis]TQM42514.1 GT2 family glycosyltransferase [Halopolyspora algeriensis]
MDDSSGRNRREQRRLIDWTGERCVPWADNAQAIYEHYHRYAMAARFVRNKRVLDLASGEGYGASMLAAEAADVVGVDIDTDAVEHAEHHYGGRNLSFRTGSITDPELLAESGPFDVIVCFEAIEHVADHAAVLRLVRARLAGGGLFLVSTPDTTMYHDRQGNENPFHIKELAAPQFESLLEEFFRHVAMLKQNVAVGSLMTPADPGDPDTAIDGVRLQTLRRQDAGSWSVHQGVPYTYLLGLASDRQLPRLPAVAALLDAEQGLVQRTASGPDGDVSEIVEQRDAATVDIARLNELCRRERAEIAELESSLARSESLRADAEQRVNESAHEQARLRLEIDRLGAELHEAQATGRRDSARMEWLRDTVADLEARVADAEQRAAGPVAPRRALDRIAPRGTFRRVVRALLFGGGGGLSDSPEGGETGPLRVPRSDHPLVSVILPVHGEWPHTRRCLRLLARHPVSVPFEVIVVDDASADGSAEHLAACEGVRSVRTERILGFGAACDLGAEQARGEYLFFLHNDAEVTESWLDILVATLESDESIGLVGAKLLGPDGRMRECGSAVWSDGTVRHLGREDDADAPVYNVLRDVDCCSSAALLVRAGLFRQLGGFDPRYAPAYYEDVDLAFAVRAAGFRTVVQPRAAVVHHEGTSHAARTGRGANKHRELNRGVFVDKWADTLFAEHVSEGTPAGLWLARQRGSGGHFGPLVLVTDQRVPHPDVDSGSGRMRHILEQLVGLGCRVVFLPADRTPADSYTAALQQLGVTVLPEPHLQRAFLTEAGSRIDLALVSRSWSAWSLAEELRISAPRCVLVHDTAGVHFRRLQRQAELADAEGNAAFADALRRGAFVSRQRELGLVHACDVTLVASEAEQALLRESVPDADVRVLSQVHEVQCRSRYPGGRRDVLFVGDFDHPPNIDAVLWAARDIMPLVRERCPEAVLHVVGGNPTAEILRLDGDGVEVHGWVADLAPLYDAARVTVAPLRFGTGVKGKVGESLGAGVPVVGTAPAMEGVHLTPGGDVLIADDARGLADGIVRLLTDDRAWQRLSTSGQAAVAAQFGPDVSRATLQALLATVATAGTAR